MYLPDSPRGAYLQLLGALEQEFTYTFGGCTIVRGLDASYLSQAGSQVRDRINLIYADAPYAYEGNAEVLSKYASRLKDAAFTALKEEAILVAVVSVHHPE